MRHLLPVLALLAAPWAMPAPAQEAALLVPAGTPDEVVTALRAASLTLSLDAQNLDAAQDFVAAARADYRRLLTALYAEGYYGGVISITIDGREAASIQPLDAPSRVARVELSVVPGPRFAFGRAAVGPLAPATQLPAGFATGEPARSETVREAVAAAIAAWRDDGNAKAAVASQDLVADQPAARLDASVLIDPGPDLAFGPIAVTGNQRVRTERVLAIAGYPEGLAFSPASLQRSADRLRRSGAFESVALVEADEPVGATLPVTIQMAESLPRRIGFGAEISSTDGVSADAFLLFRNLLGGAERLRLEAAVTGIEGAALDTGAGGPDYSLGASFARPATFGPDTDLTLSLGFEREDAEDYLLDQLSLEAGVIRYASDDLTITAALGVVQAFEETAMDRRAYTLLTLPLGLTLDRRDDPLDARRGFFIDAEATPFLGVAGDGGSGARAYADARAYRTLGRVTLAGRGQLGSVLGASRDEVPQDFLFFSGGGGTVRGQEFRSLGVEVEEDGETLTLGGASFAGIQAEARVGITGSIGAVAFADAGAVAADAFLSDDRGFQAGLGVGARYATPIGPIRLDVATPATGDGAFGSIQLYIGIGQSF